MADHSSLHEQRCDMRFQPIGTNSATLGIFSRFLTKPAICGRFRHETRKLFRSGKSRWKIQCSHPAPQIEIVLLLERPVRADINPVRSGIDVTVSTPRCRSGIYSGLAGRANERSSAGADELVIYLAVVMVIDRDQRHCLSCLAQR